MQLWRHLSLENQLAFKVLNNAPLHKKLSISFSTGREFMQLWRHLSLEKLTNFDSFFCYFLFIIRNEINLLFIYIVIYSCSLHHIKIWHFNGLR